MPVGRAVLQISEWNHGADDSTQLQREWPCEQMEVSRKGKNSAIHGQVTVSSHDSTRDRSGLNTTHGQ